MNEYIVKIKPYSYLINVFMFILKVIVFLITKSYGVLISSFYNLIIGFTKKKIYSNNKYDYVGYMIILASFCFIVYSVLVIIEHKLVNYNLYNGLLVATISFFDIGYSIYGIVKSKCKNKQLHTLKLVNLATSLISLQLTQSAILSFTQVGVDNSLYNGLIGILAGIGAILVGIVAQLNRKK